MTLALLLIACSTTPELPTGPDPAATAEAAGNLCKLFQGARIPCKVEGSRVAADGKEIAVEARFDHLDERLGVSTFRGVVTLRVDGKPWITRMSGYGSGREEAIQRGLHEWALLEGTAFIDALRVDADQAALRSVEPTVSVDGLTANQRPVYRGWTLQRPPLEGGLDHTDLVRRLSPVVAKLDPSPHTLRIEAARNLGKLEHTCYVDGVLAPDLCEAVSSAKWPEVGGYELRQTYMVGH